MIALIYALPQEIKSFLSQCKILRQTRTRLAILTEAIYQDSPLLFCQTGVGMANAHEATEELLRHHHPDVIFSVGYAGGCHPGLKTGDLLVATEIQSETPSDRFVPDPSLSQKMIRQLREEEMSFHTGPLLTAWKLAGTKMKQEAHQRGIMAIDMETAAIAAVILKKPPQERIPFLSLRVIFDSFEEELPFAEGTTEPSHPLMMILKNPRSILKIPKYCRMNQACQKAIAKALLGVCGR